MPEDQTIIKQCSKCGTPKPLTDFYPRKNKPPRQCKACESETQKLYNAKNHERVSGMNRAWAARNPEKVLAARLRSQDRCKDSRKTRNAIWAAANPEKMKASRDAWRRANPNYVRDWAQHNKDKINSYGHNRRARYVGRYTQADITNLMARQRGLCANPLCRISLESGYNVDHIEPIIKGGTNWPDNVQLLCWPCNRKKDVKDPYVWAQETGRLFV